MKKAAAIAHFGSARRLAEALAITKGAVSQWEEVIPEGSAYKLQAITGGKLRVDRTLYRRRAASASTNAA